MQSDPMMSVRIHTRELLGCVQHEMRMTVVVLITIADANFIQFIAFGN